MNDLNEPRQFDNRQARHGVAASDRLRTRSNPGALSQVILRRNASTDYSLTNLKEVL